MKGGFDRSKSLQEIENHDWGEPDPDVPLAEKCHRLRRKPLAELTTEDLRLMIGQQISLPILVPLAVEVLEADPFAEGNCFQGDLLSSVLRLDEIFWNGHADSLQRIVRVVGDAKRRLPLLDEITRPSIERVLQSVPSSWNLD